MSPSQSYEHKKICTPNLFFRESYLVSHFKIGWPKKKIINSNRQLPLMTVEFVTLFISSQLFLIFKLLSNLSNWGSKFTYSDINGNVTLVINSTFSIFHFTHDWLHSRFHKIHRKFYPRTTHKSIWQLQNWSNHIEIPMPGFYF